MGQRGCVAAWQRQRHIPVTVNVLSILSFKYVNKM